MKAILVAAVAAVLTACVPLYNAIPDAASRTLAKCRALDGSVVSTTFDAVASDFEIGGTVESIRRERQKACAKLGLAVILSDAFLGTETATPTP